MNKNLFIPVVIIVLVGCRQRENVEQLKSINRSLEQSNGIMHDDNKLVYKTMEEKLKDPVTHTQASVWMPRVEQICKHTDSILATIESLKNTLLKQTDSLREEDASVIKALAEPDGVGVDLMNKIAAFKDSIPAVFSVSDFKNDTYTYNILNRDIVRLSANVPLLPGNTDSLGKAQRSQYIKKWVENNFEGSPSLMAMMMLNKIENDVLATKKVLIEYCINQAANHFCGYKIYAVAVSSSSYVKRGQTIEVTAGVGEFIFAPKCRIQIDGKEVSLNQDAAAVYQYTATGKPGKHSIPVKIEYERPDGSLRALSKDLKYIIAE